MCVLIRYSMKYSNISFQNQVRPYYTVTAITGVYEYDLNDFLVKNGLSMLSQPLNVNETVGGMLALSTHVGLIKR